MPTLVRGDLNKKKKETTASLVCLYTGVNCCAPQKLREYLIMPLISRTFLSHFYCYLQVFPGAWTAILISLDNVGVWNLRTENLDSWYLGQETYIRIVNPEATNKTEFPIPDNALFCGALSKMQKYVL